MMEMVMEAAQEAIASNTELAQIIKGKRTKRQRGASPPLLPMTTVTTSSSSLGGGERERISNNNSTLSPSTSVEFADSTGEEEDMANCLILLAQGHHQTRKESEHTSAAAAINNIPAVTNTGKASSSSAALYVYQCKTCNRCFPSFQALGGHRASHKKPKVNNEEKKPAFMVKEDADEEDHLLNNMSTALSLQITNRATLLCSNIKSNKVHECSICGAEFSSGQALGGHMRRHRGFVTANTTSTATPTTTTTTTTTTTLSLVSSSPESHQEPKKPKTTSLELDLNLPAPEDHDNVQDSKFHFSSSKEQVVVFSASPLVDCHY